MTDSQKWLWMAGLVLTGFVVYLLAPVFTPFLLAALLAYLGDPLADWLESRKLSRTVAVTLVFALLIIVLLVLLMFLLPLLEKQLVYLAQKVPEFIDSVQHRFLPWLSARLGMGEINVDMSRLKQLLMENWQQAGGIAKAVLGSVGSSGLALAGFLGSLILVPVVTFYLLRDWDVLVQRVRELIPRRMEKQLVTIATESDEVLGAFIRGQLLVMLSLGIIYSVGLWLIDLKLSLLLGMLSGLVSFVPYLGFIVGIITAGIAMFLQTGAPLDLVYVVIVFGIGQALEGTVLTPALVGDRIGLHPVAVIFAVMAGGQLFGFVGVLLALPVAAVLAVLLRHLHASYKSSKVYDEANQQQI